MQEQNMREQDGINGGRTVRENKESDVMIERALMGLSRNLALEFPRIH